MRRPLSSEKLSDTLTLSVCHDGIWIYDKIIGCNLAMHSESRDTAFLEVIRYYQKRLMKVESDYKILNAKVEIFVEQFTHNEDENNEY